MTKYINFVGGLIIGFTLGFLPCVFYVGYFSGQMALYHYVVELVIKDMPMPEELREQ